MTRPDMLPIGMLMIEHRLIERMLGLLEKECAKDKADPGFVSQAVDFFQFYADRCHHGKEEEFLFKELEKKPLIPEHCAILKELLDEHVRGRQLVNRLRDEPASAPEVMRRLVDLYRAHILKEDTRFFVTSMGYFSKSEQSRMLAVFRDFDMVLIHERYKKIIDDIENKP